MGIEPDDLIVGRNVARLRKAAKLSQRGLAQAMRDAGFDNWHQNTVSRIENGLQAIGTGQEEGKLTELLGDIFEGTELAKSMDMAGRKIGQVMEVAQLRRVEGELLEALSGVGKLLKMHGQEPQYPELVRYRQAPDGER